MKIITSLFTFLLMSVFLFAQQSTVKKEASQDKAHPSATPKNDNNLKKDTVTVPSGHPAIHHPAVEPKTPETKNEQLNQDQEDEEGRSTKKAPAKKHHQTKSICPPGQDMIDKSLQK